MTMFLTKCCGKRFLLDGPWNHFETGKGINWNVNENVENWCLWSLALSNPAWCLWRR